MKPVLKVKPSFKMNSCCHESQVIGHIQDDFGVKVKYTKTVIYQGLILEIMERRAVVPIDLNEKTWGENISL